MKNEHLADRLEIYIFGKRFGNTNGAKHGPYIRLTPEYLWEMSFTGSFGVTFSLPTAPCFLHRWAQTVLLGIRYRRVHAENPSWCCQKCGENIGWLGRFVFTFLHKCKEDAK
jgi:hypothetical protein